MDIHGGKNRGVAEAVPRKRSFAQSEAVEKQSPTSFLYGGDPHSDSMFVVVDYQEDRTKELGSLNTVNGRRQTLEGPPDTHTWIIDENNKLRMAVTRDKDGEALQALGANGGWRTVAKAPGAAKLPFTPELFVNNTLYVHAANGGDKAQLYRYDIERAALDSAPLVASPEFDTDADGGLVTEGGRLLGFRYLAEAKETVWFDKTLEAQQKEIDALLPATTNRISRGTRSRTPYVLVQSSSPQQPVMIRMYNGQTKVMTNVGTALPKVVPAHMATSEPMRYKARDGLLIPAFVTLPKGVAGKNLPTIILVKPNSWSRHAKWNFDPEVQFLVSRGYAVIQPESRGTAGFGQAHLNAGRIQWGQAMQDDLADAAKWAIAEGVADPKRICIAGTGYGGYAAMMGLVKDGATFRCGISWAGIVDIGMMFKHQWKGADKSLADIKALVGDPVADKARFDAASPLQQAARIKQPVFLAYGAQDEQVPVEHGRALFSALKPGNPLAEFHLFDEKEQAWSLESNRAELWTKIEQFLEKHNGKP